ncbi:MAG TPA: M20 aminoacylase family protein [Micavibrio sp.]
MPVINRVADFRDELAGLRRSLHENPQTAYEETFASDLVAKQLTAWGIPFRRGIAVTGIVATIEGCKTDSGKSVGLRADMDALDLIEKSGRAWASKNPGKMHGCGHDGHTSTLLGAAKYLQETRNFNGKVHLIFQPAEEGGRGADRMIEEGLFRDFPCDYVFGYHNWPTLPAGTISMRTGGQMASVDEFHITIRGVGGHAAMPNDTIDPVVIASHIVSALQSIVGRNVDPTDSAVISVTNLNSGTGAFNVIPDEAKMIGTVRTFDNGVRDMVLARMRAIIQNIAAAFGATAESNFILHNYATVNGAEGVALAAKAAAIVVGEANVDINCTPSMAGEDFSAYLREKPGAFVFIGQGVPDKDSPHNRGLHHPGYDFNDDILPIGVSYFATLVEDVLRLEK